LRSKVSERVEIKPTHEKLEQVIRIA
jgi:hypothetical protein